jgi:PAS domain S-box-containing protein
MKTAIALKKLNFDISDFEELLFDHSIVGITDEEGIIIYANKNFCKISKYSANELIGNNHRMIKSDHHDDKFFNKIWKTISSGDVWEGEINNKAKDGTRYWVRTIILPINDNRGIKNYIAIRTDITKEKEIQQRLLKMENSLLEENVTLLSEVEKKSDDMMKSEKLITIGAMASRIAHDLKNPLTIIHTYADMLTPEILSKLDSQDKEKWLRLQNSVLDMNRIIEDVLDFAKTTEIKKKKSSFLNILRLATNHVRSTYGITINLPEKDILIKCDPRKMEGVMSNLLNNSVQALDGKGTIDVLMSSDSKFLTIQVKDSGSGIPDNNLNKIFEPMFTTKSTGTGLGLVICKSIVEQHGGTILVSNKPTTFTVTIPL